MTDLAGYHVYYGTNPYSLTQEVDVPNAAAVNYVIRNLRSGTWYFAVTAYTNTGLESCLSVIESTTVT